MNAMCKVIIIKVLQRIFGLWFHEITHICNIYLLNPASLANQEMLISTMILVWNGSKNYSNWGVIIFHPIWAFFPIRICRKTLILGPRWFAKSSGYVPFDDKDWYFDQYCFYIILDFIAFGTSLIMVFRPYLIIYQFVLWILYS